MQSVASTSRMSGYPCGSPLPQHGGLTLVPSAPSSVSPGMVSSLSLEPRLRFRVAVALFFGKFGDRSNIS
jgi:hypothetical protein